MQAGLAPLRMLRSGNSSRIKNPGQEGIWALKNIDLSVNHGEVFGIIGRNGAGKSTLLKVLSGITEPTAGYADIYGRIGSLLEVGTGFHMELTGRENVFMNGAILGMTRNEIKRKFDEIVAFAEVEKFIDTPVKWYSSGMFMRLAFAVAAHLDPEILLVDEVLAVGDTEFQKKCLNKIGGVAKEGRTVLFVSHNMLSVKNLCQRAVWLHEGKLKAEGDSAQVVSNYLKSNTSQLKEQVWSDIETAPGNEIIRLHRIRVQAKDGLPSDQITTEAPFVMEVEFWNLVPEIVLNVNLHLITEEQILAFSTSNADKLGWWTGPMPAGLFRSVCHVPAHLLKSGLHTVSLLAVKDRRRVVYRHEDVLTFEVDEWDNRPGGYFYKSSGAVSPLLRWTTEFIGDVPANHKA